MYLLSKMRPLEAHIHDSVYAAAISISLICILTRLLASRDAQARQQDHAVSARAVTHWVKARGGRARAAPRGALEKAALYASLERGWCVGSAAREARGASTPVAAAQARCAAQQAQHAPSPDKAQGLTQRRAEAAGHAVRPLSPATHGGCSSRPRPAALASRYASGRARGGAIPAGAPLLQGQARPPPAAVLCPLALHRAGCGP